MYRRIRKKDGIFLAVVLLLLLFFYFVFGYVQRAQGEVAQVTIDGELYGSYSLKEDQIIEIIIGENVKNVLTIEDGKADMTEADCPDHLCVQQKNIYRDGETIVCLPNKIVVTIISDESSDIDAIAS